MSSEESVTECIRELEGLEQKPDIDHGEVDFVPAAKTESLVGELINITNESSVADPENKGPAATSKINVTVVNSRNVLKTENDYRKRLVELIQILNKQATIARERRKEGELLHNKFEMKCEDTVRNISRKTKTTHEKVKSEETTLLEDLEKKYIIKVTEIQSDIDELQMKCGKLVSMISYIEMRTLHHKDAAELMAVTTNLNQNIKELLQMEDAYVIQKEIIEFQPCDDGKRGDLVGILRSDVCITKCTVDGVPQRLIKGQSVHLLITTRDRRGKAVNPNQKVKVTLTLPDGSCKDVRVTENVDGTHTVTVRGEVIGDYKVSISLSAQAIPGSPFDVRVLMPLVKTLGKKGKEDSCFNNPRGIAFDKDGNLVVADSENHRIQVIDLDGKMVRMFTFTRFDNKFEPWDVAISEESHLFMSDYGNKQIVVSDANGKFMISFGQTELRHPIGIAIHPHNGVVYVTDWDGNGKDTDKDGHYIRKYTQDGKYINSFGGFGRKEGQFEAPYSVDFDSEGKVYVSDCNNHRVQVFDESDHFVRSFGRDGKDEGQFDNPSGIAVGKDNFVYVADAFGNKIQKFDINGQFMYRIGIDEDNLNRPRGIVQAVDGTRKLIVTDGRNHCIKVFVDWTGR
ncbi:tripartite motif-containing protein 2-like [Ptychodera flava]|uniref:tripartite motif-containing protein 2-like n=1 Tax=Ptychodera flava TaxID=63121 RepID=UPI003969C3F5